VAKIPEIEVAVAPPVATTTAHITISPLDVIVPEPFRGLVDAIVGNLVPKSLGSLVGEIFPELEAMAQKELVGALQRRVSAQITRSAGNMLAHSLTKAIDNIVDDPSLNLPQDKKNSLGEALATQAAHELAKAAAYLLSYPKFQEAVVLAKLNSDAAALIAARGERAKMYVKINESLINVGRVVAGDPPQEQ
jgi:hypothetical protein